MIAARAVGLFLTGAVVAVAVGMAAVAADAPGLTLAAVAVAVTLGLTGLGIIALVPADGTVRIVPGGD